MTGLLATMCTLQHGDSFFPSGSIAFSMGAEALVQEGVVKSGDDIEQFIRGQLKGRWASFDRLIVARSHAASNGIVDVKKLDRLVEAQSTTVGLRDGSRRSGRAMLKTHCGMGTDGAEAYLAHMIEESELGHLPVMQGFLWARVGISQTDCVAMSAHTFCVGLLGAALRLGVIGSVAAQAALSKLHCQIDALTHEWPRSPGHLNVWTPVAEIASMRHETMDARLFAN